MGLAFQLDNHRMSWTPHTLNCGDCCVLNRLKYQRFINYSTWLHRCDDLLEFYFFVWHKNVSRARQLYAPSQYGKKTTVGKWLFIIDVSEKKWTKAIENYSMANRKNEQRKSPQLKRFEVCTAFFSSILFFDHIEHISFEKGSTDAASKLTNLTKKTNENHIDCGLKHIGVN